MQTLTLDLEDLSSRDGATSSGFFARLMSAREQAAKRRALAYLAAQSDARLTGLGYSADDIAALRAGELRIPATR